VHNSASVGGQKMCDFMVTQKNFVDFPGLAAIGFHPILVAAHNEFPPAF
jgi:hypothetical protein